MKMVFVREENFLKPQTVAARSVKVPFYPENVIDLWDLERKFISGDTAYDWLVSFDFGSVKQIKGVFVNDVNFDWVTIEGSNDGVFWKGIATVNVKLDERVQRRKTLVLFNASYRYARITVPSNAKKTDTTSGWRIGTLVFFSDYYELIMNPDWGYTIRTSNKYMETEKQAGSKLRISLSKKLILQADMPFQVRYESEAEDFWVINSFDQGAPLIFSENMMLTSNEGYGLDPFGQTEFGEVVDRTHAYLCLKDSNIEVTYTAFGVLRGSVLRLVELV